MLDFHVFGTVYRDWDVSIADVRGQACGFARYTPVCTIRCRSILKFVRVVQKQKTLVENNGHIICSNEVSNT